MMTLGWVGCSDDDSATCGDGKAEGSEQCDLTDLKNRTCADVVSGSQGTLTCTATCTYDVTNCAACGDGTRQFGEQCDCGTNSANLPAGCTDVNGGANANCSADCAKLPFCGDGVVDQGETCDCGTNSANLPAGCTDVNGGANANCTSDCETIAQCNVEGYWQDCDPLVLNDCCVDDYGVTPICAILPTTGNPSYCMRECTGTTDCFWSNFCFAQGGNICWPEVCGTSDWPNTQANAFCTVSGGGGEGYCWPIFSREAVTDGNVGICIEAGTLAHGATCDAVPLDSADRSEVVCDMGFCGAAQGSATGKCMQFCDWEKAYAVAFYGAASTTEILPCPTGANCFAEATLDSTTGLRSGDLAYCYDSEATDPTNGMTTCSLVNSRLLSNPSQTCTDAGFANGRCVPVQFSSGDVTYGALVGVCQAGTAAPNKAVWETCDSTLASDVCPPGTICEQPDLFDTTPALAERCIPMCDTAHADGAQPHCADLGAVPTGDGTPVCRSLSYISGTLGPTDTMKTRLGLCGMQ
jgi:hypothetical protein